MWISIQLYSSIHGRYNTGRFNETGSYTNQWKYYDRINIRIIQQCINNNIKHFSYIMDIIVLLILCIFLIIFSAETVEIKSGVSKVIRLHVEMPPNTRKLHTGKCNICRNMGSWRILSGIQFYNSNRTVWCKQCITSSINLFKFNGTTNTGKYIN